MAPAKKKEFTRMVEATLTNVAFTIKVPKISFTLNYSQDNAVHNPPTILPNVSLAVGAVVGVETSKNPPTIQVQGASAVADTGNPVLNGILNEAVVPFVLALLNKQLLAPMNIPTLSFDNITVAAPSLAIQNGFLLAYTAVGNVSPSIPPPNSAWPTDGVFAAVDATIIAAAGSAAIAAIGRIGQSFDTGPFTGNVTVNLGSLSGVKVNRNGTLSATLGFSAGAGITWHTPNWLPNISFSASASGSIAATLGASVSGGSLVVTIHSLDKIDISSFDFEGIPIGGIPGVSDLENWLINQMIKPIINRALSGMSFKVYQIPPIHIPIGSGLTITLPTVGTQELDDVGKAFLVAHGQPVIT
jgi:hypothetical protein